MSYTPCKFDATFAQVDGTSYACVVALALKIASSHATRDPRKVKWEANLKKLRDDACSCPTNMIGGDLREIVGDDPEDKHQFIKGLYLAEARIKSFKGQIPNSFLREVIGQGERVGYIQDGDYDSGPFVKTIRTLLKLLAGESAK